MWLDEARFLEHRTRASGDVRNYSPLLGFRKRRARQGVMTKVELVRLIGDVLRQLDNLKTNRSADLSGPVRPEVRNTLAKQQLKIAITDLDETTPAFFKAIEDILALKATLHGGIESADNGVALDDNLKCFVKTVDGLVESRH
jgi:hypothetical protein